MMKFALALLTFTLTRAWDPDCTGCLDDFTDDSMNLLQKGASKTTAQTAAAAAAKEAAHSVAAGAFEADKAAGTTTTTTNGGILSDGKFPFCAIVVWCVSLVVLLVAMCTFKCF
mmetsp:Transcript_73326/g.116070  ORF Transcript_73326/g.116070 Transcript_73326/m.116070 type:complete len:114 (+) Transcript_73326:51-392(+)